jgi:ribosomal protein S5
MAPGRKLAIVAAAVIGVGAGGVGVTQAVSGEANQATRSSESSLAVSATRSASAAWSTLEALGRRCATTTDQAGADTPRHPSRPGCTR